MFRDKLNKFLRATLHSVSDFLATQSPAVELKQIEIAFLASSKNLTAGLFGVCLIVAGIWLIPSPAANRRLFPYLLAWALVLVLVLARGIHLAKVFEAHTTSRSDAIRQGRRLAVNGAVAGLLWGSSSFLLIGSKDIRQSTFLVCAIGLVIMGGAGAQAQYGRLVTSFVCSTTIMFVIGILVNAHLPALIGYGFIVYAGVAILFARQQQLAVKEIIELNLQNQELLRQARQSMHELEQARAAAESANRAKTRFLAATGHDLRQPMHALSLYVAHLRLCRDRHELSDTLDKADAAIEAMKDLLNAVLDLSRISLGAIRPAPRCVEMDDVLERVKVQLQGQADAKGLQLQIDRFHGSAMTDPVLLERILCNIVLNAIRYTRFGRVTVRATRRGRRVTVRVADTGIGIPRRELAHVFEEFYQLDNPERDRHKGLGLGLAIVAQLGTLLSHRLSLRSRVGRGTVFRIELDACADTPAPITDASPIGADDFVSGCAVLLIDDDPLGLDSMVRTLRDFGCQVTAASSTLDALTKVGGEARIPDIILSDYRLKRGETGIDAIRIIRENLHGENAPALLTPGLIISGDTAAAEIAAVAHEGLIMLHKPLAPALLRAKMNELLRAYSMALHAPVDRKP